VPRFSRVPTLLTLQAGGISFYATKRESLGHVRNGLAFSPNEKALQIKFFEETATTEN